jgi:hypothetical protein
MAVILREKSMQRMVSPQLGTLAIGLSLLAAPSSGAQQPAEMRMPAPELQGIDGWINSKPTSLSDLKGKVVVLHFWTFG